MSIRGAVALVGLGLSVLWPFPSARAQPPEPGPLWVPAGGKLRAVLDGRVGEVRVASMPKVVAFRFGRHEDGRFVAYPKDEPMPYDEPFFVQVHFSSSPIFDYTVVTLTWEAGGRKQVPLHRSRADPTIFESLVQHFDDPIGCRGLVFCTQQATEAATGGRQR